MNILIPVIALLALTFGEAVPVSAQELSVAAAELGNQYGEEELLLRFFLGIVFPIMILVVLRMTRYGIRHWELNWRRSATKWIQGLLKNRGLVDFENLGGKIVGIAIGVERIVAFGFVTLFFSLLWFALFPQTRTLATDFVKGIIGPVLDWIGRMVRDILLILYSALLLIAAVFANRFLSGRFRKKPDQKILGNQLFIIPLRIIIWLIALFLCFFPYPGVPRFFAVGLLLIAFFVVFVAIRPIIEEIAIGFYLQSALHLKKGDELSIDGIAYRFVHPGLAHATLDRENVQYMMPYSRIMKSTVIHAEATGDRDAERS